MILAKLFTKIFKEGGIILIDSENQKYICGSPRQIKPITIKLLKKDLTIIIFCCGDNVFNIYEYDIYEYHTRMIYKCISIIR